MDIPDAEVHRGLYELVTRGLLPKTLDATPAFEGDVLALTGTISALIVALTPDTSFLQSNSFCCGLHAYMILPLCPMPSLKELLPSDKTLRYHLPVNNRPDSTCQHNTCDRNIVMYP